MVSSIKIIITNFTQHDSRIKIYIDQAKVEREKINSNDPLEIEQKGWVRMRSKTWLVLFLLALMLNHPIRLLRKIGSSRIKFGPGSTYKITLGSIALP